VGDLTALALLGAYHGINPGMGWLFAVALGLQQRSARGVWRALPPIILGHAAAVAVVLAIALAIERVLPPAAVRAAAAVLLIALGSYRLWRHRHPVFGGMQVGFRDLVFWSFLMASAHGAGLMLLPFTIDAPSPLAAAAHEHSHATAAAVESVRRGALAVGVHTLSYIAVMALAAAVVYWKLGLAILRTAWFNMDALWAVALLLTGLLTLW
jgi:hypothetical protein